MARRATSIAQYRNASAWGTSPSAVIAAHSARPSLRILGIDPGSRYTGYGVIEVAGVSKQRLVAAGRIATDRGEAPAKLAAIFAGLQAVIAEHAPAEIAIEETFVNRANPQSALVLGQARGVALLAAALAGVPIAEYAAASVKLAVAGHGRADKAGVQHMVGLLLGHKGALAADAADALAVALCHAHSRNGSRGRSV